MRRITYLIFALILTGCGKPHTFEEAEQLYKKQNYPAAIAALTPLAEKGDYRAQLLLGLYYLQDARKDLTKAAKFFMQAADQGDIDGLYFLGTAYLEGKGVPQNVDVGEQYLLKSAKGGSRVAMRQLGFFYSDKAQKSWLANDFRVALSWYEQAFEYGDSQSALLASGVYGHGPLKDSIKSAAWSSVWQMTAKRPSQDDPYQFLATEKEKTAATMMAYRLYGNFGKSEPAHTYLDLSKM